jgi:pseudaminic acid cytidylyltransferase
MLAWSIEAAKKANCFSRIIVSTDDREIAMVAESYGAEAPFQRDATLSDDYAPTHLVIADTITRIAAADPSPVCCLYPTSPLLKYEDLRLGLEALQANDSLFVMAVTTFPYPIQRAMYRSSDGHLTMVYPENVYQRSQDLEQTWHDAGQFYWATSATWKGYQEYPRSRFFGLVVPRYRVLDIDTPEDWTHAEVLLAAIRLQKEDR